MTDVVAKEYKERKFNEISMLDLGGIHRPTIYVASIYSRENKTRTQWDVPENDGRLKKTKEMIADFLKDNYDLKENGFAILAFPHVTTFFRHENTFPQSTLYTSLWNTLDMSPNVGIVHGENESAECPIESKIKVVENSLWGYSKNLEDYYSKDRSVPMGSLTDAVGFFVLNPVDKFR